MVKNKDEIIAYRKFLYADEYEDGNVPDDVLNPPPLSNDDIIQECKTANEFGFKYFSYCPNCHDSWFGAGGLDVKIHKLNTCNTCGFEGIKVFDSKTFELRGD